MNSLETSSKRRALITGAGGFVGSHLTEHLLERGDQVVALGLDLSRLRHLESRRNLQLMTRDVAAIELYATALSGVDTVFHLAAAHLERSHSKEYFWEINVRATRALAKAALRAGVRRFIHVSSVGVYGPIENPPADESTLCRPELPYEQSKLEGEFALREVADGGLPFVILRPVWIYGPGCPRTARLFSAVRRRRFLLGGGGHALRHCLYIDDMVRALLSAAESEKAIGQVVIVGDREAATVHRLVGEIARLAGVGPPGPVPLGLLRFAVRVAEAGFSAIGKEPPVSRRSLRFFTANTAFDTSRARQLLGFEPEYDLETGLAATWAALQGGSGPARPGGAPAARGGEAGG